MEYRSKHPMDILKWIEKVIDSCETYQQIGVADKLLRHYRNLYVTEGPSDPLYRAWRNVDWKITSKQFELLNKK